MKTVLLGLVVSAFAVAPAAAGCSFGMAHVSEGAPAKYLAMSPAKPKQTQKDIQTANLKDGWLVKYLDRPVS
ncbi:MAG: hypothetical protein M9908_13265 [Phyllobacteriaceae bacterium]|nr:hypothetical protein [Phyllobacteriaceae bacterium]